MNKTLYFEQISPQTEKEVDDFIVSHQSEKITYWEWRDCLTLIIKVYNELAESVKDFGAKVDKILEPYKDKEITDFDSYAINSKLSKIAVVKNQNVHNKISILNKYHY